MILQRQVEIGASTHLESLVRSQTVQMPFNWTVDITPSCQQLTAASFLDHCPWPNRSCSALEVTCSFPHALGQTSINTWWGGTKSQPPCPTGGQSEEQFMLQSFPEDQTEPNLPPRSHCCIFPPCSMLFPSFPFWEHPTDKSLEQEPLSQALLLGNSTYNINHGSECYP